MKRILSFIFAIFLFNSCTTEEIIDVQNNFFAGQSFQRTVNFTSSNGYFTGLEIPLNIELLDTDMVLVYRLVGIDNDGFNVWRPLPEIAYTENGDEFQYNFDHNFDFVDLYLYAPPSFDLGSLSELDRLDQTFRIVILPVDFVNSSDIDLNDYDSVMEFVQ
ncbi:hypothetical protein [Winogradskyella pulchriflava]|uniref:Dihydrolipoamide dehydrogenase n=1 Tax=Winogradskyella pulchriflava TaxID=1110688 RepID=A0ABV6QAX4_9FLAO